MAAFAEALVEFLLPARCATCRRPLPWRTSEACVCPTCWQSLRLHETPRCASCGSETSARNSVCLACRVAPPPWQGLVSVGPHEDVLRDLVLLLKFGRHDELAAPLATRLHAAIERAGWPRLDLVTAVPLSPFRRLRRGFNQAELIARPVARGLRVPYRRLLQRRRGVAQVGRSRAARLRLPAGTFRARGGVSGRVLLIDDVFTTGATARACTATLHRAGAAAVYVATVAYTPPPGRAS